MGGNVSPSWKLQTHAASSSSGPYSVSPPTIKRQLPLYTGLHNPLLLANAIFSPIWRPRKRPRPFIRDAMYIYIRRPASLHPRTTHHQRSALLTKASRAKALLVLRRDS